MQSLRAFIFGSLILALMIGAPLGYNFWYEREYRNFHVVEDGVLYRSGQFSLERLQKIVRDYNIRTVVSLRDGDKAIDEQEEHWVKATRKMRFFRLPHRDWNRDTNGVIPAEVNVKAFRAIMDDPSNYPVLVHCFAGVHRTGTMCAIYRMDFNGWTNEEAMNEMRMMGYTMLEDHDDVYGYFLSYRPPVQRRSVTAMPVSRER